MRKDEIEMKLLAKHVSKEEFISLPIAVSKNLEDYLKDIKILYVNDSIDSDLVLKDFGFKEGRALYKQKLILVRTGCDREVVYHEIGHFLCLYLKLAKNSNYDITFLNELIYMYEIDGRNRYVLTPTEYYPQAFALYCIRPNFVKQRLPRTYNLLSSSGILQGTLVSELPPTKSYFSFLMNKASGNRISVKRGNELLREIKTEEHTTKLYNLVAYSDKRNTEETYNKIIDFFKQLNK